MAAPTVSSITPDHGEFSGGYYLTVTGTGFPAPIDSFDFHYDPSDTDEEYQQVATFNPPIPTPAPEARLLVTLDFGGGKTVNCITEVFSTTKVSVLVPRVTVSNPERNVSHSEVADVVLTPLDGNGDPILGDVRRVTDGFTMHLPYFGADTTDGLVSPHDITTRQLITDLRAYVLANTIHAPHQQFELSDDDELPRTVRALPALVVAGPQTIVPKIGGNSFAKFTVTNHVTGESRQLRAVQAKDFIFDLLLVTHSAAHQLRLMSILEAWIQRTYFRFTLFEGTDWETTYLRNIVFDSSPAENPVPMLLADSLHNTQASVRIIGIPVGISSTIEHDGLPIMTQAVKSSLIHGALQPKLIEEQ